MELSSQKLGRLTGLFYFMIILSGLTGSLVFRGSIVDMHDPLATLQAIRGSELLYRLGFLSDLIMVMCDVIVSVLFYVLLRKVHRTIALFAMAFRLIQSSVLGANLINLFTPLLLINRTSASEHVIADDILRSLELFDYGYLISGVFFAVNCLLMGYLIVHSTLIPKWIGVMIGLAAVGYMSNSLAYFVLPGFIEVSEMIMFLTAVLAEVALCFYLLIKGTKHTTMLRV